MHALKTYLDIARRVSLPTLARLVASKLERDLKHGWGRWHARAFGIQLTDAQFKVTLTPDFADATAVADWMRAGRGPKFFVDSSQRAATVAALRKYSPDNENLTIAAANQVCAHVFDLLGSGPMHLGDSIDWHVDFKTGHHYDSTAYYADCHPAPYLGGHDIKVPWELSRCQHFVWLGEAYWYSSDEIYAREFVAQVEDWIERNPPELGVNWASSMEIAIRAVNWLWGLAFFRESAALTDEFLGRVAGSLLLHGRHIAHNLERQDTYTGNHYLADLVGMVMIGTYCPYLKEAEGWREFALAELWKELEKQVYPDGVNFEASIGYHRFVTEFFLSVVALCQLNDIAVPQGALARIEKMVEFVLYYTKPDGTAPLFGDFDNGRLHRLKVWGDEGREWLDHRYLLAVGAVLFGRDDYGMAAGDQWEEAIWGLGLRAVAGRESLSAASLSIESKAFTSGGIYTLRGRDMYMAVDAGRNGQNGNGGHAHNDTLSFELFAGGQTWITDAGTYIYTQDYEARQQFRSTAMHNVLMLDGQEISPINAREPFAMKGEATPKVLEWQAGEWGAGLVAGHNGYDRLGLGIEYRRSIYFDAERRGWLVRDQVKSSGAHQFTFNLHLTPCEFVLENNAAYLSLPSNSIGLAIYWIAGNTIISLQKVDSFISWRYGHKEAAPMVAITGRFEGELDLTGVYLSFDPKKPPSESEMLTLGKAWLEKIAVLQAS
jgi:uncharacterized heparinase superfamily protein